MSNKKNGENGRKGIRSKTQERKRSKNGLNQKNVKNPNRNATFLIIFESNNIMKNTAGLPSGWGA